MLATRVGIYSQAKIQISLIVSLKENPSTRLIVNKIAVVDKAPIKESVVTSNDMEASNAPRNVRDLEKNSKILDFQNKILSSASIGPYPISSNYDHGAANSITKETESVDK